MTEQTEVNYNRRITMGEKAYDEVSAFIGMRLKGKARFDGGYTYYTLNGDETQIIRANGDARTIEISDKVDPELVESINHIIRTEIRGSDLSD